MIDKYPEELESIYERIVEKREKPLEVIKDYYPVFKQENIGPLGIFYYLKSYIQRK